MLVASTVGRRVVMKVEKMAAQTVVPEEDIRQLKKIKYISFDK
jgi:hypothetical protein